MDLFQFQKRALAGLPANVILAWDTGCGKSVSGLAHVNHYHTPLLQRGGKLLIIAPASKVASGDWEREIERFWPDTAARPAYEILSYNRLGQAKHFNRLAPAMANTVVVFDEAHAVKNPSTIRGKQAYFISRKAAGFVLLTATPMANGWIDAINYFRMFGLVANITSFKKRYVNIRTLKGYPEIMGYFHEDELGKLWRSIASPLKKSQALDLPDLTTQTIYFERTKEYQQIVKTRIKDGVLLENPSQRLHALRQATIDNKIGWIDDFIEGASSNVVIFYSYIRDREQILAMLAKSHPQRTVFRLDGDKRIMPTKDDWPKLSRTITVAQYQSGGTGIELTYADTIIYATPTYSYQDYEQSIGRIYRYGQGNKCTLYRLLSTRTVEQEIYGCLDRKQDFSERQWIERQVATCRSD